MSDVLVSLGKLSGQFTQPTRMCIDQQELFIADYGNHRIQTLDLTSGKFLRQYGTGQQGAAAGELNRPNAVFVHGVEVVVCDTGNCRLVVFDRDGGQMLRSFGSKGSSLSQFNTPTAVVINNKNEIFVSDLRNHRVMVFE